MTEEDQGDGYEIECRRQGPSAKGAGSCLFRKDSVMADKASEANKDVEAGRRALSRWENEGGAAAHDSQLSTSVGDAETGGLKLTNVEYAELRIRVIALENIIISLLATASKQQLDQAREMADYISPRPDFTPHPLTIQAAAQMNNLVERASRFRE